MKQEKVARRYATALYTLAKDEAYLNEVLKSLELLKTSLVNSKELSLFILSPQYTDLEKEKVIKKIFEAKLDKHLFSFILFLLEKGRLNYLEKIIEQVEILNKEDSSILDAEFISTRVANEKQRESLKKKLSQRYGKNINLICSESEDLLAGFIVKIEDKVIDCSIKNQLSLLKESFVL